MRIILRRNPSTGKLDIVIKLDPDPDAPPLEHEVMHRALVEVLVGKEVKPEELGELIVERDDT
jgi:hypothetical protein